MEGIYFMFCYGIPLALIVFMFLLEYAIEHRKSKNASEILKLLFNVCFCISVILSSFSWLYCLYQLQNMSLIEYCFVLLLTGLIHMAIWLHFGIRNSI